MQPTIKKSGEVKSKNKDKNPKEDFLRATKRLPDEKLKKDTNNVSTPKNYIPKSSTADIYTQKKKSALESARAPKKVPGVSYTRSNVTPMKDILKSSPSSTSLMSSKSSSTIKSRSQRPTVVKVKETPNTKVHTNVTVNSPVAKRKLNMNSEIKTEKNNINKDQTRSKNMTKHLEKSDLREIDTFSRQRSKTRTLKEEEVKILTPEAVDNNAEMLNLTKKLAAKAKAFFVDLDEPERKVQTSKLSDEEESYEDDFESYESDFDSYHSELSDHNKSCSDEDDDYQKNNKTDMHSKLDDKTSKEPKDDEKMLDSGSYDIKEFQSTSEKNKPLIMEFIKEELKDGSEDKKISIISDEGFQELSTSSGVSSMKHVDVIEKPHFVDLSKSREYRRKRKVFERLKQREKDILSMVTLHEISYSLFEMKPIPYDSYMAIYGRSNCTQSAVQTFEGAVTQEVQTEEIINDHKWTQHPVAFSNFHVCLSYIDIRSKNNLNYNDDYLSIFTNLTKQNSGNNILEPHIDESYTINPLRVFLEQKDGVGGATMLPYMHYKSKLKNVEFSVEKLRNFLRKKTKKVSNILSKNNGNNIFPQINNSKIPFSKGFIPISPKTMNLDSKLPIKEAKISNFVFSQSKSNLLMTVHDKLEYNSISRKCLILLWDISMPITEPIKILISVDSVLKSQFIGNIDGIFVAALKDGSIQLWDLLEEPTWNTDNNDTDTYLAELMNKSDDLTDTEKDREWNFNNKNVQVNQNNYNKYLLHPCDYTNSAINMRYDASADEVVGLEIIVDTKSSYNRDGAQKVIGKVCSLTSSGILTLWNILQEKSNTTSIDLGKAFWSRMKLEKSQTFSVANYFDKCKDNNLHGDVNFNLRIVKERLLSKKIKNIDIETNGKSINSGVKSRPISAARKLQKIQDEIVSNSWENGVVCSDLKVMIVNKLANYLIGKNCGEILCCVTSGRDIKIKNICVATDLPSVTCIEASPHGLPYFLAATNTGTLHLCSLLEARVLLTLDCRNDPRNEISGKYVTDFKGRYIGSVKAAVNKEGDAPYNVKAKISKVAWSRINPCSIFALTEDGTLSLWELTHSDIHARYVCEKAATLCAVGETTLALLTSEGEIEVHQLADDYDMNYLDVFNKYISLL